MIDSRTSHHHLSGIFFFILNSRHSMYTYLNNTIHVFLKFMFMYSCFVIYMFSFVVGMPQKKRLPLIMFNSGIAYKSRVGIPHLFVV